MFALQVKRSSMHKHIQKLGDKARRFEVCLRFEGYQYSLFIFETHLAHVSDAHSFNIVQTVL